MQEVKIRIRKDGSMELETSGFKGKACDELTEKILKKQAEAGISTEVTADKKKAEYYEQEVESGTGIHV